MVGMLGDGCELQFILDARATQSFGSMLFKNSLFPDQINSEMSKKKKCLL